MRKWQNTTTLNAKWNRATHKHCAVLLTTTTTHTMHDENVHGKKLRSYYALYVCVYVAEVIFGSVLGDAAFKGHCVRSSTTESAVCGARVAKHSLLLTATLIGEKYVSPFWLTTCQVTSRCRRRPKKAMAHRINARTRSSTPTKHRNW